MPFQHTKPGRKDVFGEVAAVWAAGRRDKPDPGQGGWDGGDHLKTAECLIACEVPGFEGGGHAICHVHPRGFSGLAP